MQNWSLPNCCCKTLWCLWQPNGGRRRCQPRKLHRTPWLAGLNKQVGRLHQVTQLLVLVKVFYTSIPICLDFSTPHPPRFHLPKKFCDERVNPITTISTLNPRHGVVAKARATGSTWKPDESSRLSDIAIGSISSFLFEAVITMLSGGLFHPVSLVAGNTIHDQQLPLYDRQISISNLENKLRWHPPLRVLYGPLAEPCAPSRKTCWSIPHSPPSPSKLSPNLPPRPFASSLPRPSPRTFPECYWNLARNSPQDLPQSLRLAESP